MAPTADPTAFSASEAAAMPNASNQRGALQALQMLFPQELQHTPTASANAPESHGSRHDKTANDAGPVSSQPVKTDIGTQVLQLQRQSACMGCGHLTEHLYGLLIYTVVAG